MKSIQEKIEVIKSNGYELSFGNTFEFALKNYKKIAVYAGLMLLVFLCLFFALISGLVLAFFDFEIVLENLKLMGENPEAISRDFILSYFAFILLISCLLSPFQAGFLKMAECGQKGEEFHVSTIFEYYKSHYFASIVLATLIITLPGMTLSILLDNNDIKFIGSVLSIIISFLTFLTIPLIVFGKLNAFEAIKSSCIIMIKKPFDLWALLIVAGLLSIVGIIGCGIGLFFTIPFLYSMTYAIYSSIISFESNDKIENIERLNE